MPELSISERNAFIKKLEAWVVTYPDDDYALRRLVDILDNYVPEEPGIGKYTESTKKFERLFQDPSWASGILRRDDAPQQFKKWLEFTASTLKVPQLPIAQIYDGSQHTIAGANPHCQMRLDLFNTESVITSICNSCYKVQILPLYVSGLFHVYFLLRDIKLPRNNSRKCMVEFREDVAFPYKGYIYCESEAEAEVCLKEVQQGLAKYKIPNVAAAISHGCSEFGLKYPSFKFAKDGSHRSFQIRPEWERKEKEYFAARPGAGDRERGDNKAGISIRDMIGFNIWLDYAEIIGDPSVMKFRDKPNPVKFQPFASRVGKQAQKRHAQMEELKARFVVPSVKI